GTVGFLYWTRYPATVISPTKSRRRRARVAVWLASPRSARVACVSATANARATSGSSGPGSPESRRPGPDDFLTSRLPGCSCVNVILRRNPSAPLAGSLRAGQARGLRSQARFAQGRRRRISFSLPAPELRVILSLRRIRNSYWEHLP